MNNIKYSLFINNILILITVFFFSYLWEFFIEPATFVDFFIEGPEESDSERWEYVYTVTSFCFLALIFPTVLSIKKEKERGKALEKIRLQSKMLTHINEGVCLSRHDDNNIIYANSKFEEMFGYNSDETIGKPISLIYEHLEKTNGDRNKRGLAVISTNGEGYGEIKTIQRDGTILWYSLITSTFKHQEHGKVLLSVYQDISTRKLSELELRLIKNELEMRVRKRTKELEQKSKSLKEANIALKVLMEQQEKRISEHEENIMLNIEKLVSPSLENLKRSISEQNQAVQLDIIETNLNEIITPLGATLSVNISKLTPAETQVVNLIKQGKTTKEIAGLLNLSPTTISTQRQSIRKKLGLTNKKRNLQSALSNNH